MSIAPSPTYQKPDMRNVRPAGRPFTSIGEEGEVNTNAWPLALTIVSPLLVVNPFAAPPIPVW